MDFDAVLLGVLRSTTEMEKIKELDGKGFQCVIDVLGQVSTIFSSALTVFYLLTLRPPVRENWGCGKWTSEEVLQVPV